MRDGRDARGEVCGTSRCESPVRGEPSLPYGTLVSYEGAYPMGSQSEAMSVAHEPTYQSPVIPLRSMGFPSMPQFRIVPRAMMISFPSRDVPLQADIR